MHNCQNAEKIALIKIEPRSLETCTSYPHCRRMMHFILRCSTASDVHFPVDYCTLSSDSRTEKEEEDQKALRDTGREIIPEPMVCWNLNEPNETEKASDVWESNRCQLVTQQPSSVFSKWQSDSRSLSIVNQPNLNAISTQDFYIDDEIEDVNFLNGAIEK